MSILFITGGKNTQEWTNTYQRDRDLNELSQKIELDPEE